MKTTKKAARARLGGDRYEMWPLDAPGMPPPGEDFLAAARAAGDGSIYSKKTRKGEAFVEFKPGPVLTDLYRRALREPGFRLAVQIKPGKKSNVVFIPGHVWGEGAEQLMESMVRRGVEPPPVTGPQPAEVMVLGKMPWYEEVQFMRNLVGATGEILTDFLARLRVKDARHWYVANLVKFMPPEVAGTRLRAGWIKDCLPLLHQELRIVRPKYILCLGADASTALLGKQYGVGYMEGRVVPYEFPVHRSHDDEPEFHRAQVMTILHPAEVARDNAKARIIERGLSRFSLLVTGVNFDKAEDDVDHRVIDSIEDAEHWAEEAEAHLAGLPKRLRLVAWDAEWEGQHPMNTGAYLRSVQVAWAPKHAVCFKIAHAGGGLAFRDAEGRPALDRLARLLNRFMKGKRLVGHFLNADLEWLHYYGIHPDRHCQVPLDPEGDKQAWELFRDGAGCLDTAAAVHAVEETAALGLEVLGMRYTTAPRWDIRLEEWKKRFCAERGLKAGQLEGYGECPDEILMPYGAYDADVTLRIMLRLLDLLDCDYDGNCCWEPFWETMIMNPVILDIHKNGITVDRARIDVLTKNFITARADQEQRIRHWARWDEFNIRSTQHVREFLFGARYNGKRDKFGNVVRIRPDGARSLRLTPLLDTSKPPRRWEDIVARGLEKDATPGTGKTILGILAQENPKVREQVGWIRDYRFLDQVLKSALRPPLEDEEEGGWLQDDDGFFAYDAGLAACVDVDGRVRTHLIPTAETGRLKSFRPNLQNLSKSRDGDYRRLLGDENYKYKLRSILKASGWDDRPVRIPRRPKKLRWVARTPGEAELRRRARSKKKYALVEFDYTGAELYGMAIMSGDEAMINHAERALLPDSGYDKNGEKCPGGPFPHPDYYDIHSNVAVLAFQLKVPSGGLADAKLADKYGIALGTPFAEILGRAAGEALPATKRALDLIGKSHFRTLAKNVIFGIAYGRGAKAIAFQAKEQGVRVTAEQAQAVIDTIFGMYTGLVPFFEEARSRAVEERWLCHCFGRFRRFPAARDYALEGEFERQAMNFPIQGMIASAVDRGLARLRKLIYEQGLQDDVRILLQIHDAGLLEVALDKIEHVKKLVVYAMRDCVPIYPSTLDGRPTGAGPYYLGLEFAVEKHWGERFSKEEIARYGIAC